MKGGCDMDRFEMMRDLYCASVAAGHKPTVSLADEITRSVALIYGDAYTGAAANEQAQTDKAQEPVCYLRMRSLDPKIGSAPSVVVASMHDAGAFPVYASPIPPAPAKEETGVFAWVTRDESGTCDLHPSRPSPANEAGVWEYTDSQRGLTRIADAVLGDKRGPEAIARVRITLAPEEQ